MTAVTRPRPNTAAHGFSLIEMMVVIVIISIVVAAVLAQVNQTQQRAIAEQSKLDQFQAARNFVDQVSIDARQMGFPNTHNFDVSTAAIPPWPATLAGLQSDTRIAVGLVKLTNNSLQFEGDVTGSGTVSEVSYAVNGDGLCATCLERAQLTPKVSGVAPLAQALIYSAEIQNVQNTNSAANPIFRAFDITGAQIPLPIDIVGSPAQVAKVRVIQVSLDVSDPNQFDPKTRQPLEANITSRVQVVNCSMAGSAAALGIAQVAGGVQLLCQP
ncbi:MAG: prepilin-type N-terminal cleavage/methylation domain-containing protein [Acidobacteriota bacterium]|nr:prepilin-type N-terminal cleavage/methylation domain-containing protein [Acidobacteriota bacterium]